jgi:hypothetical protein
MPGSTGVESGRSSPSNPLSNHSAATVRHPLHGPFAHILRCDFGNSHTTIALIDQDDE